MADDVSAPVTSRSLSPRKLPQERMPTSSNLLRPYWKVLTLMMPQTSSVRKCPRPENTSRHGRPLGADEIYKETWLWLKNRGCEKLVNKRLLESYSLAFARFIQCEDALSTYGLLGKHPTTGGVVASPFASLSQSYQKQANLLWYEIFDIVKQNCTTKFDGSPQDDMMEQLLRSRK